MREHGTDQHATDHGGARPIRVFLVDDDDLFREGVRRLLSDRDNIEVVGEAGAVPDALDRMAVSSVDVALVDIRMPSADGIELCREVRSRYPQTACIMLTGVDDEEATYQAVMAGAAAYVLKRTRSDELARVIEQVAGGNTLIDARIAARLVEGAQEASQRSVLAALSETEREVLDLIGEGLTNREIAARVHLAEKTVKNHVSRLLKKLDMERRAEIIVYVAELKQAQRYAL